MTEITYRFKTDPFERPDQRDTVPDDEVEATKEEIIGHDGIITGTRTLGWRELLARHESHKL